MKNLRPKRRFVKNAVMCFLLVTLAILSFAAWQVEEQRAASLDLSWRLAAFADYALKKGYPERAMRLAALAAREGLLEVPSRSAAPTLAMAAARSSLALELPATQERISPDGKLLLTFDKGRTARIWDAASLAEVSVLEHLAGVKGATFDDTGKRVLSWDEHGNVQVWSAAAGVMIAGRQHQDPAAYAIFDAAGEWVTVFAGTSVQRWDVATSRSVVSSKKEGRDWNTPFGKSRNRALFWELGVGHLWNTDTAVEIATLQQPGGMHQAKFDPAARRVVTWGGGDIARIWNAVTGVEVATLKHRSDLRGALFGGAGERLLTWGDDRTVRVWQAANGTPLAAVEHEAQILGASFDARAERVLSWDKEGLARIWDAATGAVLVELIHPQASVSGAAFDATGERVLSWDELGWVRVWRVATGAVIAASKHEAWLVQAIFDGAGERVLSWDHLGASRLWNAATGVEVAAWQHDDEGVLRARFDATGDRVIDFDNSGTLRIWQIDSDGGAEEWSLPRPSIKALVAEVCARKLRGTEAWHSTPYAASGEAGRYVSVRRISSADAELFPVLRDRIGEDVCIQPSWPNLSRTKLAGLLPLDWW